MNSMDLSAAKPIEITDKLTFDKYFKKYPPEISELTFTNLFMWRKHYDFLFAEANDHLLIFSKTYLKKRVNSLFFLPPIGPRPENVLLDLFNNNSVIEVHRVPESLANVISIKAQNSSLNLELKEDRNNWDYVYNVEELIDLAGNKFRQKRRWLVKFLETYKYEFHIITQNEIDCCKKLQLEWCAMNKCQENADLFDELHAINEIFDNYATLNIKGGLITIQDQCVAYTLGEMLNRNTLVIHIEKAHLQYEGSYQAINNLFLKNCCNEANFVNREQDVGDPGLRKAKEDYKPVQMVKKAIIARKPTA